MIQIKRLTIERIIIALFSVLPVVDTINGILLEKGMFSIGTLYKMFILGVLLILSLRRGCMSAPVLLSALVAVIYIAGSVLINVFVLSEKMINTDYPVKLLFNILTIALLINCTHAGYIDGNSYFKILDINTWLMIIVILVPYVLGLGSTIYSAGVGYKGFFYSNNELSAALIILFYFSLFRLGQRLNPVTLVQLLGITVCVLLLNTKSGIVACFAGCALFVVEYLVRKNTRFKLLMVLAIVLGLIIAKDFIIAQVDGFLFRQNYLYKIYGGSLMDTILSGRTFFLEDAWHDLFAGPAVVFRFLFGNGFCSSQLVEMDFIDIFFYLGFIGFAMLTGILIVIFIKSWKNFKTDGSLIRPCGFLMIIGFAFLAGHVFFMATAGFYFVLICCFGLFYSTRHSNTNIKGELNSDERSAIQSESILSDRNME